MTDNDVLNISLSAIQSYRTCQQQYAYRYVERLRKRDRSKPLELGSLLHKYLELYYGMLKDGVKPNDAHEASKLATSAEFTPQVRRSAKVLYEMGQDALAKEMLAILPMSGRIADRYFLTRGEEDAEEYEILLVEEELESEVAPGFLSRGKIDMITRSRDTGLVELWEHKSTGSVPSTEYRLRDLQTTLYKYQLEEYEIDQVVWNYIRTKEPTVPKVLKSGPYKGGLTHAKSLDSTWEVFAAEIKRHGFKEIDYLEQRKRLEGREESVYFPRYPQVILANPQVLLRDYVRTAKDIKLAIERWRARKRVPVRTLSLSCDWCDFKDLCNAVLLAGSDKDARARFTKGA